MRRRRCCERKRKERGGQKKPPKGETGHAKMLSDFGDGRLSPVAVQTDETLLGATSLSLPSLPTPPYRSLHVRILARGIQSSNPSAESACTRPPFQPPIRPRELESALHFFSSPPQLPPSSVSSASHHQQSASTTSCSVSWIWMDLRHAGCQESFNSNFRCHRFLSSHPC